MKAQQRQCQQEKDLAQLGHSHVRLQRRLWPNTEQRLLVFCGTAAEAVSVGCDQRTHHVGIVADLLL